MNEENPSPNYFNGDNGIYLNSLTLQDNVLFLYLCELTHGSSFA